MNNSATETSVVVEREISYPPARLWRALSQPHPIEKWLKTNDFKPVVDQRMELSGSRPDRQQTYRGARYGWQKRFAGLERVAGGLS